jgi:hypothetical protein
VKDSKSHSANVGRIIRWVARAWSIVSLVFVGSMLAGEVLHPTAVLATTPRDLIGLALFPFGTCVGMLLAWRWEGLGGAITLGSLVCFYVFMFVMDGRFPGGPFFVLVATPGALFAASWASSRSLRGESGRLNGHGGL